MEPDVQHDLRPERVQANVGAQSTPGTRTSSPLRSTSLARDSSHTRSMSPTRSPLQVNNEEHDFVQRQNTGVARGMMATSSLRRVGDDALNSDCQNDSMAMLHRRLRDEEKEAAHQMERAHWDSSPRHYVPPALKGLRPTTSEPWARDERTYQGRLESEACDADRTPRHVGMIERGRTGYRRDLQARYYDMANVKKLTPSLVKRHPDHSPDGPHSSAVRAGRSRAGRDAVEQHGMTDLARTGRSPPRNATRAKPDHQQEADESAQRVADKHELREKLRLRSFELFPFTRFAPREVPTNGEQGFGEDTRRTWVDGAIVASEDAVQRAERRPAPGVAPAARPALPLARPPQQRHGAAQRS